MTERTEAERLATFRQAIADASEVLASGKYDFGLHKSLNGIIEHASSVILTSELAKQHYEFANAQGLVQGGYMGPGQGQN